MFTHAITRLPGRSFSNGITTSILGSPSYELMLKQHAAYCKTLEELGLEVIILPAEEDYPDAHFVEDTAVVTPDLAVITNPGARARQGEEKTIEPALEPFRTIHHIKEPGTLDGGDVLMVGNHFFIGISDRTNIEGADQLGKILEKSGNTFTKIQVAAGLHFKSSVNAVGEKTLLVTNDFKDAEELKNYELIVLDAEEEYAGNTLLINDTLIMPAGFPGTRKKLETLGTKIIELDMSETRKMDGGLTCLSLRF